MSDSVNCPVYVASHRRSGTHLTLDNLVNNFPDFSDGFANFDTKDKDYGSCRLFKTHFHAFDASRQFEFPSRVIYVVRDGRDVMVSLYYYAKSHDPSIAEMSFADFLHTANPYDNETYDGVMNRVEYWAYHVNSWVEDSKFEKLVVSFDQWRTEFKDTIGNVASMLDMAPKSDLRTMARTRPESIVSKAMRKLGLSKRTSVNFRGGRSGDWKEHFDQESLEMFNSIAKETYEKLPAILKFENSL